MRQSVPKTLQRIDGYLPIEDYGLVGDGATAALIGRDGAVAWLCLPRFDSSPLFCSVLDHARGGAFRIASEGLRESRQYYEPDSAVLVTEMQSSTGRLRLTDCCPLISGADLSEDVSATRRELLRSVTAIEGTVRLNIEIEPRGGAEAGRETGGEASLSGSGGSLPAPERDAPVDGASHAGDLEGRAIGSSPALLAGLPCSSFDLQPQTTLRGYGRGLEALDAASRLSGSAGSDGAPVRHHHQIAGSL